MAGSSSVSSSGGLAGSGESLGGGSQTATGGAGGAAVAACLAGSGAGLGVAMHPFEGNTHLVACSPTSYATKPPSSGPHYPIWPVYRTYTQPVPWGFLVHGLEHGAVIVVYNCPAGCADEVAQAQAWIDALPTDTDPYCRGEKPRVIMVPDPTLDVRWAATAWTWTLRGCTFDAAAYQQFFLEHYNQTYELGICRTGTEADWSATGWCG